MTTPDADLGFTDARPTLEVADLEAALGFFTGVAGFSTEVTMGDPPTFAIVGAGGAAIGLTQVASPALPEGAACYLTLGDVDRLAERCAAAGLTPAIPPTDRPWGMRDLVIGVPGGGPLVAFGQATS